ncbi:gustatory receptor for sugar taste 64f-like [Choristoneura fumiferana]|uniref:gustatory receptor for sugar taste 64f-like n=1 Tax=Choristoneura fumiferana TaxID=7141 RepID=UPI003D15552D
MHLFLQYPLQLCKWAGFFPVEALNQPLSGKLRFNLYCPYILYYTLTVMGQAILTTFGLYQLISNHLTLASLSNFLFNGTAFISTILLLRLAQSYSIFLKGILQLEYCLAEVRSGKTLKYLCKSNTVVFIVMGLALVENLLSVVFVMNLVMDCVDEFTFSAKVFRAYFMFRMPAIYKHTPYSIWKAILLEIANFQATFLWNFIDVLIMCSSVYLISYCQDINRVIRYMKKKNIGSWEKMRIHYCHLMTLVMVVDSKLSYFVLLSFFINLFFICLQLFNTLKALNGIAHSAYYSFSFLFLVLRAMTMSLLAANVHAAARKPIFALRSVTSSSYTVEVQRLQHQITYTKLALSGHFFYVTRDMILKVVATIVTYELVLLQFSRGHGKHSSKNDE